MKYFEKLLRNSVVFLLKIISGRHKKSSIEINNKSKILLIRLNNIGDALVTTPLINILKKYTGAEIKVIASKRNYFVFQNNPHISEVIIYNKSIIGFFTLIKKINSNKFDCILDSHTDTSTTVSMLIALSKSPLKICLNKDTSSLYNLVVPYLDSEEIHIVEKICKLALALNIEYNAEDIKMEYNYSKESEEYVLNFLKTQRLNSYPIIGINFFAGSDARFWGIENYKNLIKYLTEKNFNIIPISDIENLSIAKKIIPEEKIFCRSFDELAALISKLDFLITPDTSLVHLCSIYNIPSVIFFVKYNFKGHIWTPYKARYEAIITEEPTLKNIPFAQALEPINKLLGINE